jgi:hypothetical protein
LGYGSCSEVDAFTYKITRLVTAGHVVTVACCVCVTVAPLVTVAVVAAVVYTVFVVVPTLAGVVVLARDQFTHIKT